MENDEAYQAAYQAEYNRMQRVFEAAAGVGPMVYDFTPEECKDLLETLIHRIDCVSYEAKRQRLLTLAQKISRWQTFLENKAKIPPIPPYAGENIEC